MEIKKVGVVGAGTMGAGIALVCAQSGREVVLNDLEDKFLQKGMKYIDGFLAKSVEKGKLDEAGKTRIMDRFSTTVKLEALSDVDLVIEAALEKMEIKKQIFTALNAACRPETVIASNTSSLSVTEMAMASGRPDKFVGMHFFNPAPIMKLVEVVQGLTTSDETAEIGKEFSISIGKDPVVVKDTPGFVVNRILVPMINEAIFLYSEGAAPAEEIDKAMRLGAGFPMGPLALADLVGLDVLILVLNTFYAEFGDPKYRPAPLLKSMVRAGWFGKKSGKGFYDYGK